MENYKNKNLLAPLGEQQLKFVADMEYFKETNDVLIKELKNQVQGVIVTITKIEENINNLNTELVKAESNKKDNDIDSIKTMIDFSEGYKQRYSTFKQELEISIKKLALDNFKIMQSLISELKEIKNFMEKLVSSKMEESN